ALLKVMFDHTPDSESQTLARPVGLRFHLSIGVQGEFAGRPEQRWEAHGLRHLWPVLEALPPADVEDNRRLNKMVRYVVGPGSQAEGIYGEFSLTAGIGYDPTTVDKPDRDYSERPDPMY